MKKRKVGNLGFRKGNAVLDTIFAMIIVITVAIVSVVAWNIWTEIEPDISEDITNAEAQAVIDEVDTRGAPMLDGAFVFIFIGMWIFVIVASLMIDAHPLFFVLALILLIFAFIGFGMFGNFYEEFFADPEFSDMTIEFPATFWIMTHLLQLGIGMGVTVGISLYAKAQI